MFFVVVLEKDVNDVKEEGDVEKRNYWRVDLNDKMTGSRLAA